MKKILVVDDDSAIYGILKELLDDLADVYFVSSMQAAEQFMVSENKSFLNMVIVDACIPYKNGGLTTDNGGERVYLFMSKDKELNKIPFILMVDDKKYKQIKDCKYYPPDPLRDLFVRKHQGTTFWQTDIRNLVLKSFALGKE